MNKGFFVTGIGTGVGKTLVSAALCDALEADYWKPIQCGNLDNTDSRVVKSLISNKVSKIHPEQFLLKDALSPHAAAQNEKKEIFIDDFEYPQTTRQVIVEGAGGIMVPLNYHKEYVIDLSKKFQLPVIVVVNFYLGSINHTLLTLDKLDSMGATPQFLIFTGKVNRQSADVILSSHASIPVITLPELVQIDSNSLKSLVLELKKGFIP